jgi:transcriptional regulator MraZ
VASFRGSFSRSIDQKGRLALSKQFRRVTGVKRNGGAQPFLVLTRGLNDCVWGFTEDEWPKLEARLRANQLRDQNSRSFVLEMMRHVEDVGIDSLGRILIPQSHLDIAGLARGKEVLVLGMLDHLELWNPERYEKHIESSNQDSTYEEKSRELFSD